jgi:membrane-bound ClpP family serine protease
MKNLPGFTLLSLAALLLLATPSAWGAERMQGGQWEMTSLVRGHSQTSAHCVTPEELKAVNGSPAELRAFLEETTKAAHCKVENLKMEGNIVSYTTACATSSIDSTTTYHGDHFEMVMETKGGGDSAKRLVKARRLGACP